MDQPIHQESLNKERKIIHDYHMKRRRRETETETMEIVWQTPANPPERQDYIFQKGMIDWRLTHLIEIVNEVEFWLLELYFLCQGDVSSGPTTSNSSLMSVRLLPPICFSTPTVSGILGWAELLLITWQVKNRWAGQTIVDFFTQEFKGRPYEYYVLP